MLVRKREKINVNTDHENTVKFINNQHIFHTKSLVRFCDKFRTIGVANKNDSISFRAKIDSSVFNINSSDCLYTENTSMRSIEIAYHNVIRKILSGYSLNADEHLTITKMYALWKYRSEISIQTSVNCGNINVHKNDSLEKSCVYFDFSDKKHPQMIKNLFELPYSMKETCLTLGVNTRWAVLSAIGGEFVIPDLCPDLAAIPMSPTQLLMAQENNDCIDIDVVDEFNKYFVKSSKYNYYYR